MTPKDPQKTPKYTHDPQRLQRLPKYPKNTLRSPNTHRDPLRCLQWLDRRSMSSETCLATRSRSCNGLPLCFISYFTFLCKPVSRIKLRIRVDCKSGVLYYLVVSHVDYVDAFLEYVSNLLYVTSVF